ncbi:MAG TPA: phytoene/squalene synthase family protein [Candidatus Dormibacteraeota bacterium]|jgi:phytoene synthase|nr:phytoene/squalene synthase family protein [Candidatus Dormibacteraeota bacterium]
MSAGAQQVLIPWTPAPAQLHMAYSVCRGITRTNAKNFYYAFLVLPKRKRQALCAVYAFMRRCDDITDDATVSLEERRFKLETWLAALHRAQQGEPTDDPILLALTDAQRRYTIPAGLLDELAMGTAMDVIDPSDPNQAVPAAVPSLTVQYHTFDDLKLYCYRVASVVGLVCIHIFGYRDPAAEPLAERCGLAFQLTNIIRDVKEDAAMGRVYLPEEDLAKFGLSAADLLITPDPASFRPLLALEAGRARDLYQSGDQLIPYIAEDSQPALWVLINIYRKLLEKIAARDYDVFTAKVSLTVTEKLRVLGRGFLQRLT